MVRYTSSGGFIDTWGFPGDYQGSPNGVAVDGSGNVFVTDYDGNRVQEFTSSGALLATWGSPGLGPGQFSGPADVAVNGSGDVFVLDVNGTRVQKFTNGGSYLMTIGSAGSGPGQFQTPEGVGLDASGRLYVADAGRSRILRFQPDGTFDMEFPVPVAPLDVAAGPDGNVYVVPYSGPVLQYSFSGLPLQGFAPPGGLSGAYRIAIGSTGAMYVTEEYNTRVTRFQLDQSTAAKRTSFGRLKAMYR